MADSQDDFVTIRPRRAPLTGTAAFSPGRGPAPAPGGVGNVDLTRRLGLAAVLALLVGVGIWVFVFLPSQIDAPEVTPPVPVAGTTPALAPAPTPPPQAPLQSLQQDLERQNVQGLLARFVELQIRLDDEMGVSAWAADEFAAAQRLANEGDEKFLDNESRRSDLRL